MLGTPLNTFYLLCWSPSSVILFINTTLYYCMLLRHQISDSSLNLYQWSITGSIPFGHLVLRGLRVIVWSFYSKLYLSFLIVSPFRKLTSTEIRALIPSVPELIPHQAVRRWGTIIAWSELLPICKTECYVVSIIYSPII